MGHITGITEELWPELGPLVDQVVHAHAAVARAQAAESRLLADAVDLVLAGTTVSKTTTTDLPLRCVAAELGAALRTGDRTVQRRMSDAYALREGFVATLSAWENGAIDASHVSAILSAGTPLDAENRARFEQAILDVAQHESAGRLQSIARAMVAQIDPPGADERIRAAEDARHVRVYDTGDGMSRLLADLPAVLAHAIHDRLTQQARSVHGASPVDDAPIDDAAGTDANSTDGDDDPPTITTGPCARQPREGAEQPEAVEPDGRTIDQLRADILCDTLLAGAPLAHGDALRAIVAHVQVTMPLRTLAGAGKQPANLAGSGPVGADCIRHLAAMAPAWERVWTDPATGAVLSVDRYRPTADLTRLLRARDEHCRFPGCRRSVLRCDIDHTHDAAHGGETRAENLSHLCRRHHVLKHQTPWRVRQLPGGVLEWRSPAGRRRLCCAVSGPVDGVTYAFPMVEVRLTGQLVCANGSEAALIKEHLPVHIALTRAEPGCLQFVVSPTDNPLVWQVEERFVDSPAFRSHQRRVAASVWGRATTGISRHYSINGLVD